MKRSGACPGCEGAKFFVVEPAIGALASALMVGGDGFFGGKLETVSAEVDAWVCAGCGRTELYAREVALLARMAEEGKGNVRVVGDEPRRD